MKIPQKNTGSEESSLAYESLQVNAQTSILYDLRSGR